jgi:CelD/BcsL family acetyltransferase involved in cellulose biosynthesis
VKLEIVDRLDRAQELVRDWNGLLARSSASTVFSSPEWQLGFLEAFADALEPALVVVRDGTSALAILPMARSRRGWTLSTTELAGERLVAGDHLDLVAADEDQRRVWPWLEGWLDDELRSRARVRLFSIDDGATAAALRRAARARGWSLREAYREVAPRLALPASYERYEQGLSANRRQQIRRKWRRLQRAHPSATICENDDRRDLGQVMDDLARLHRQVWNERGRSGVLDEPRMRRFLWQFCKRAHARGWLRLRQLYVDDRLVAGIVLFHAGKTASFYQSGWDTSFRPFSVGELMMTHSIRSAIDEGMTTFDFLRGHESYKFGYGALPEELIGYELAASPLGRLALHGALAKASLKSLIRRGMSKTATGAPSPGRT